MRGQVALRRQDLSARPWTSRSGRIGSSSVSDGGESRKFAKARDLWPVLPGCSNHVLEQLSKFTKSINYKIGSFAQQLRSVKTCGETHGKALCISRCNDPIDR